MKRLLVLLMVCALSASVPMTALAASSPIDEGSGVWAMSGKLTISASITNIFTVTFTLNNVGNPVIGEEFGFDSDTGYFWEDYFIIDPDNAVPYFENSKGYSVDLTGWASDFASSMADLLNSDVGTNVSADVTKASITGTATKKTMTANLSVVIQFSDPDTGLSGKITISGALTGKLETGASPQAAGARQKPEELAKDLAARWSRGLLFQKVLLPLLGLPPK